MPPFLESFAVAAKAAGEAAAKAVEEAAAIAKDAGTAMAKSAGKAAKEAAETVKDAFQDAAGDLELPDDLGMLKPDVEMLPDDVRMPLPDLWDIPDDIGYPRPKFEELPEVYYEQRPLEGLDLPDDIGNVFSGDRAGNMDLPDDLGQLEPEFTDLPDDLNRNIDPEHNTPNDSGEAGHQDTNLSNDTPESMDEHGKETKETDDPEKKMEPPAECTFKCPEGCDKEEFEKQVKGQEKGLNDMTIEEFLKNRENYKQNGRDTQEGPEAQRRAREEARMEKIDELRKQGMSRKEAEAEADKWLSTQTALHNPDQVAGGDPAKVTGVGDGRINSSIGGQWGKGGLADKLEQQVRDFIKENNIPPEDWSKIKMNVNLSVI